MNNALVEAYGQLERDLHQEIGFWKRSSSEKKDAALRRIAERTLRVYLPLAEATRTLVLGLLTKVIKAHSLDQSGFREAVLEEMLRQLPVSAAKQSSG